MKTLTTIAAVLLLLKGATVMAADTDTVAVIETKFGKMVVEFYDVDAPKTVANFQKLTKEGFYNLSLIHI